MSSVVWVILRTIVRLKVSKQFGSRLTAEVEGWEPEDEEDLRVLVKMSRIIKELEDELNNKASQKNFSADEVDTTPLSRQQHHDVERGEGN
ncbi:hypothetical protein SLEP1_g43037 [Rubroshorea leprosula]|uniref:Uncharacterized protein n=1 Tax=Rubroshorea leprosula TaxID=152421 RepID=A0AAV5LBQ5_9ROSI|nr:hypothetical protein SLEP1_g43037 [Rubroshorea leprosula]